MFSIHRRLLLALKKVWLLKITRPHAPTDGRKRMEKLDIVQQKVDTLATRIESMEKKFIEIDKSQGFQAETLESQGYSYS